MKNSTNYLLVGNGRVALHIRKYFELKKIYIETWSRSSSISFSKAVTENNIILLAISDDAIEPFILKNRDVLSEKTLIHFSGALVSDLAYGYHPLMTFGDKPYELINYEKILFVLDDDAPEFSIIFPKLKNPVTRLSKKHKPKYHALCVMANNFTSLLWQKLFIELETLKINPKLLIPFLMQTVHNIAYDYKNCLTGPLSRGDMNTIAKNIESLDGDSYRDIYKSFVKMFNMEKNDEN